MTNFTILEQQVNHPFYSAGFRCICMCSVCLNFHTIYESVAEVVRYILQLHWALSISGSLSFFDFFFLFALIFTQWIGGKTSLIDPGPLRRAVFQSGPGGTTGLVPPARLLADIHCLSHTRHRVSHLLRRNCVLLPAPCAISFQELCSSLTTVTSFFNCNTDLS
jgi:hypothetical protein